MNYCAYSNQTLIPHCIVFTTNYGDTRETRAVLIVELCRKGCEGIT